MQSNEITQYFDLEKCINWQLQCEARNYNVYMHWKFKYVVFITVLLKLRWKSIFVMIILFINKENCIFQILLKYFNFVKLIKKNSNSVSSELKKMKKRTLTK